jgi:sialic acid synthase SpsE
MANNHGGDVNLGKRIITEFSAVADKFPQFEYAFKFQYRDLPTFIHPSADPEHKYVKRFNKTNLSSEDRLRLKLCASDLGFLTACTPFDEKSVDDIVRHGYDILKVGSPSALDWRLHEKIRTAWGGSVVVSLGGVPESAIPYIVTNYLLHNLTLMHCVSEYPTKPENLQLNQIEWLKAHYPDIPIGYSSHCPNYIDLDSIAKGIVAIEKHVCVSPTPNNYSVTPSEMEIQLEIIDMALKMCGEKDSRVPGPKPTQFMRRDVDGDGRMWWKP